MFFFMTTNKKQQCYPLCFLSWRPIKNNSVTPYVFFHDDQRKTTVSPLMFHLIKTTVLPPMLYSTHFDSVTPYGFFMATDKKRVLPFTFYLVKTTVLPLMFFFSWWLMKNNSVTPYIFFSWRPIKNDSLTPYVFIHDDQ